MPPLNTVSDVKFPTISFTTLSFNILPPIVPLNPGKLSFIPLFDMDDCIVVDNGFVAGDSVVDADVVGENVVAIVVEYADVVAVDGENTDNCVMADNKSFQNVMLAEFFVDPVCVAADASDQGHQVDEKYVAVVDNTDNILICFVSFV